ncbi:hypothetical protein [Stutzerimonas stutzeri]|uniref:hypothetical protein n=1 Tax=Stutzerimonas stutzeri TaxID=316 RepID=UPI0015E47566|nr:hypothetical protein [Stutzerimonas stutzeri]MBA1280565.1 hypothetical protein [Stutzerimonas stutzeri]
MNTQTALERFPLRKPVKAVAGKWTFADADQLIEHTHSFGQTAERNVIDGNSVEYEVYAIFPDCRVLVACVDPLETSHGIQIFVPEVPLH